MQSMILLSLRVAGLATLFAAVCGCGLAWLMAGRRFRGQEIFEALLLMPMVMPPTVTGYGLLILFGDSFFIGRWLENLFGVPILFSWYAAVFASAIVSFPLMYRNAKTAFEEIDQTLLEAARTLGARPWQIFWQLGLGLAWQGVLSASVLTFARALGEFGATLMVAGNIPGRTQTLSLAIYSAVESGDDDAALKLVGIVLGIILALCWISGTLSIYPKKVAVFSAKRSYKNS